MEPDDLGLSPYYHHHHHHPPPQPRQNPQPPQPPSPTTNGLVPTTTTTDNIAPQMLYPHNSAPSAVSPPLSTGVRRKRGRPRKYGTPEQAAAAAKRPHVLPPKKKELSLGVGGATTSPLFQKYALGNAGQRLTPYVIPVTAGEDICHKIMLFMQQCKEEICILSASGSVSSVSLRQQGTSGGNISCEGSFNILKLSGSYVRTDFGGVTGALSICLSSDDGHILGGGIDGPLIAAAPMQVIVGSFSVEGKKKTSTVIKGDPSSVPPPNIAATVPSLSFRPPPASPVRNTVIGNDGQQNMDGYQFMIPNRGMPMTSSRLPDWTGNTDSRNNAGYDFSGRVNERGENGDYDHFQD